MPNKSNPITLFSMRWGGAAGDGLQSTGNLFQKYFNKLGYYVQGFPGTQSTIRGGHVWQHIEISTTKTMSFDRPLNLLVALTTETLHVHMADLNNNGYLLYNSDKVKLDDYQSLINEKQINVLEVPLTTLTRKIDIKSPILANTIGVGVILAILQLDLAPYISTLEKRFKNRPEIIELNEIALNTGYTYAIDKNFTSIEIKKVNIASNNIVISGNEMIALGAVASGLKFLAQYPITPASSILTYLSNRAKKYHIVVRQVEDELAAINMVIGASFAGVRTMTASSGPGLSLMAEAFGYASMTETPIVIVNSMRGGPSTGIPTKMEQSDLNSMIHLSHGEGPRAIFAPRNIKEAFQMTVRAFNIADIYQLPVIILSDFSLSERTENIEPFDLEVEINRGKIWEGPTAEYPEFKRYQLTEDGVSPRAFPPTKDANYILVGAEHDESSHSLSGNRCGLPESLIIRERMIRKRFKKMEVLREEMRGPREFGPKHSDFTVLCWGSTEGPIMRAINSLNGTSNYSFNLLSFGELFPLPITKIQSKLAEIKTSIMFEVNYTGQFENLLYSEIGWKADFRIHPLTGETPTPSSIISEIKEIIQIVEDLK